METTTQSLWGKAIRVFLAVAIATTSALGALAAAPKSAQAAESASLSIGDRIDYAGYNTHWMYSDGEMAYCGNPSAATPPAGTYSK